MAMKRKSPTVPSIWLTVYGDWITNLTLFFILLFYTVLIGYQRGLTKDELNEFLKQVGTSASRGSQADAMKSAAIAALRDIPEITVKVTDREIRAVIVETVLFERGKAVISDNGSRVLARVGAVIKPLPYAVTVEGHTDDSPVTRPIPKGMRPWELSLARSNGEGPYESNWELSAARAIQVVMNLTKKSDIPPKSIRPSAFGPSRPAVPNTGEENRRANRRVEIAIKTI